MFKRNCKCVDISVSLRFAKLWDKNDWQAIREKYVTETQYAKKQMLQIPKDLFMCYSNCCFSLRKLKLLSFGVNMT